ncbi:MipA/OmpV family protein [Ideonella sp.]|uniref:MipA/OmpV family protein n=1 Tax=Ideonella sp. TaxID=1929293 RepID=UPI0035B0AB9A
MPTAPRSPHRPGAARRPASSITWQHAAWLLLVAAAPAAAADAAATAAEPPTSASEAGDDAEEWGRQPPPLWTVGLFGVAADHAVYPGAARRARNATVLPFVTYRGPVLRLEGGTAGVRALRRPRAELDFSAAAAFGSDGVDKGARAGMPAIGTLVEIGPSLRVNLGPLPEDGRPTPWRLDLPLRFVFDADRDFEPAGVSFEPRVSYRLAPVMGWTPSVHAGLLFGSQRLNSLFYEVAPEYATPTRPAYEAQGGLVASRVGTSWSRLLLPSLRLGLHASVESVRGAANEDSPVVGRSVDPTFAVTLTWTAWRSEEAGVR